MNNSKSTILQVGVLSILFLVFILGGQSYSNYIDRLNGVDIPFYIYDSNFVANMKQFFYIFVNNDNGFGNLFTIISFAIVFNIAWMILSHENPIIINIALLIIAALVIINSFIFFGFISSIFLLIKLSAILVIIIFLAYKIKMN